MFLLFISIFLILFAFFSYKKPLSGVYAVIFCLPLYFVSFKVFGIPTTVLEAMIYILAITSLIKILKEQKKPNIQAFWRKEQLSATGIILLFCGAIISTAFSSDLKMSAGILKAWFFDPLLFFLIFISIVKTEKEILRSLFALALSGLAVALAAFIYWLAPQSSGVTYDGRLRAFYLSANHLAMYLAPAIIIIFGSLFRLKILQGLNPCRFRGLAPVGFTFLFISIPFYLTYSYSAWFGVLAALIFILIFNFRSSKKKLIGAIVFLVILSGIVFSEANPEKFRNITNVSYPSISSRVVIWRVAADILEDHWVIGIGPGTFQDYYLKKQVDYPPYPEWAVPQPHNIFLAFWLQTGILGLIGFMLILFWFFSGIFGAIARNQQTPKQSFGEHINNRFYISLICVSAMLYILVHGLFDTTYWKNDLSMIFWVIIGAVYVIKKQEKD